MKIKYILGLLLFFQCVYVFATAQVPDVLIYNGTKYSLNVNPMESYFDKFPEKRPRSSIMSTSLWRGYIATFEIIQNELWVIDIEILNSINKVTYADEWKSVISEVFDGKNKMKVDWFSGLLVLPQGELVEYVHMGYGSLYEYYTLIKIENGNYIREFILNYEQYNRYRNAQYELFKNTEAYERILKELNNGEMPEELIDYFIRTFEIEYMTNVLEE